MSNFIKFKKNLELATIKAQKSLIWIESFDYKFIIDMLSSLLNTKQTIVWHQGTQDISNLCSGLLYGKDGFTYKANDENAFSIELCESISMFMSQKEKYLIASISERLFEDEVNLIPLLQEFVYINNERINEERQTILLISANHVEVVGLEHICEHLFMPLPDKEDIQEFLGYTLQRNKFGNVINIIGEGNPQYPFAPDFKDSKLTDFKQNYKELIDALYGMHIYDIKELLHTLTSQSKFGEIQYQYRNISLLERVKVAKKQMVENSGLLEIIDNYEGCHKEIADIENLLEHLDRERRILSNPYFLSSKLPKPKGVLLVGDPGCGKSASAKAVASILNYPLYRMNLGSLLGHKYGQSENQFNEALKLADSSAPCVLWIDEIEKAFAGAGNDQSDDTLTHIVGKFLTWMQEHKTLVYLVATANDISKEKLKPEFTRKGRWDEIFYLTYPSKIGREKILKAILEKYGLNELSQDKISSLSDKMKGKRMSGSAIENLVLDVIKDEYIENMENENPNSVKEISFEKLCSYIDSIPKSKQNNANDYSQYKPASKNRYED